jgi:hypothetical protein
VWSVGDCPMGEACLRVDFESTAWPPTSSQIAASSQVAGLRDDLIGCIQGSCQIAYGMRNATSSAKLRPMLRARFLVVGLALGNLLERFLGQ